MMCNNNWHSREALSICSTCTASRIFHSERYKKFLPASTCSTRQPQGFINIMKSLNYLISLKDISTLSLLSDVNEFIVETIVFNKCFMRYDQWRVKGEILSLAEEFQAWSNWASKIIKLCGMRTHKKFSARFMQLHFHCSPIDVLMLNTMRT